MSKKRAAPSSVDELHQASSASASTGTPIKPDPSTTSSSPNPSPTPLPSATKKRGGDGPSGPSRYTLSLLPQPPPQPFVHCWFDTTVFLTDLKKVMKTGWVVPLQLELLYDSLEPVQEQGLLEVHPSTPARIGAEGQVKLQLRVQQVSMHHENRPFCIRFSVHKKEAATGSNGEPLTPAQLLAIAAVAPVTTSLMTVIRHRLRIEQQPPTQWYKDEGGREKCIVVTALLVDQSGSAVKDREVPLKVTLCYDGEEHMEVKNQSILKFPSETTLNKVGSDGSVELRLRIEEVSKNHQKQAFTIKIAPDGSPANFDIAADVSTPVTVLSKRNKRRKKGEQGEHLSPLLMGQAGPMNGLTSPMSQLANTAIPSSSSSSSPSSLLFADPRAGGALGGLAAAMHNVAAWCQYVHRGLRSLEWQHVGFEVGANGELSLQRPLNRCPSCWVYKDTIRPASHNERCMLHHAQTKWHQEVAAQVQQLLNLASGQQQTAQQQPSNQSQLQQSEGREHGRRVQPADDDEDNSDGDSDSASEGDAPLAHTNLPSNGSFALSSHDLPALPVPILSSLAAASSEELPPVGVVPSFQPLLSTHSHHSQHSHLSHPQASFHYQPSASTTSFAFPTSTPASSSSSTSFVVNEQPSNFEAAIDPSPAPPTSSSSSDSLIVALHAVAASYGIPAFSAEQRLLGFYVEHDQQHFYYPIQAYVGPQYAGIKEDVQEMTRKYIEAVADGSADVKWKKSYVPLQQLVEDASLHIYEHSRTDSGM